MAAVSGSPLFVKTKLTVQCEETIYGENLCLTGASDELGVWRPEHSVRLQTSASTFPSWTGTVCLRVEPDGMQTLEFKFGIMRENHPETWRWERFGDNRTITLNPQRLEMIVVLKYNNKDFSEIQYLSPPASPTQPVPVLACQSPSAPGPILVHYQVPPLALGSSPFQVPRAGARDVPLDQRARSVDDQGMAPLSAARRDAGAARRVYRGPAPQQPPQSADPFALVPAAALVAAAAAAARQQAAAAHAAQLQQQQQQAAAQQQQQAAAQQQRGQPRPLVNRRSHSTPHSRVPRLETIDEEALDSDEEALTPPTALLRRQKSRSVDATAIQAMVAQQCYLQNLALFEQQLLLQHGGGGGGGRGQPTPPPPQQQQATRCYPVALNPASDFSKQPAVPDFVAANGHLFPQHAASASPTQQSDFGSLLLRRFVMRSASREAPACPATHAA